MKCFHDINDTVNIIRRSHYRFGAQTIRKSLHNIKERNKDVSTRPLEYCFGNAVSVLALLNCVIVYSMNYFVIDSFDAAGAWKPFSCSYFFHAGVVGLPTNADHCMQKWSDNIG